MGLNPVGLPQHPPPDSLPDAPACPVLALAQVLSALRVQDLHPDQVRDTAVGLGLLRYRTDGAETMTLQNVARLFLAGYRLPASIHQATWPELRCLLGRGFQAFVLVEGEYHGGPGAPPVVLRVHRYSKKFRKVFAMLPFGEPLTLQPRAETLDEFLPAWVKAGNLLFTAAESWDDLPRAGSTFFGGHRTAEGTYHWHTAECETDAQGTIVRF